MVTSDPTLSLRGSGVNGVTIRLSVLANGVGLSVEITTTQMGFSHGKIRGKPRGTDFTRNYSDGKTLVVKNKLSAKHQLAVKGLSECKASESNFRRIQVKDIVKEVEDYLKTYSSAEMDIS
ncbi:hypothetical protein Tco_0920383 [Tanacetum coccineum]